MASRQGAAVTRLRENSMTATDRTIGARADVAEIVERARGNKRRGAGIGRRVVARRELPHYRTDLLCEVIHS